MTRRRNWRDVQNRLTRLEIGAHMCEVRYQLPNGSYLAIQARRADRLLRDAFIKGEMTAETKLLLSAESSSDGSRLHELYAAILAGPVHHTKNEDVSQN